MYDLKPALEGSEALMMESTVRRNAQVLSTTVHAEAVLMNTANGKYYGLDDIATSVWEQLCTPRTVSDLCGSLAEVYDEDLEIIRRDVLVLLGKFVNDGLIEVIG